MTEPPFRAAQSEIGCVTKNQEVSDHFETNKTWTQHIGVHVLFISKRSDQKLTECLFLKTPYPPLPYIFWTVWTKYHLLYTIPIQKLSKSRLSDRLFFWLFLVISEVGSPDYIAKSAIFKIWAFWVISMHFITLFVIEIDNIRCLGPFLPLYDHFEIWRFLIRNWQY